MSLAAKIINRTKKAKDNWKTINFTQGWEKESQGSQIGNYVLFLLPPSGDRSHVIERSMNRRSGEEERKQDFINLDES